VRACTYATIDVYVLSQQVAFQCGSRAAKSPFFEVEKSSQLSVLGEEETEQRIETLKTENQWRRNLETKVRIVMVVGSVENSDSPEIPADKVNY